MELNSLRAAVRRKKAELDRLRRQTRPDALANLEHAHDIELTHTSNALEGNTLSAAETTLVVEHGITIGGKPLKDHLEALDHFDALHYVRDLASQSGAPTAADIRNLHRLVMQRSDPAIAGRYADQGRYVVTDSGRHGFPSPAEIPALMGDFVSCLGAAPPSPEAAFTAHRRLVDIHPFNDGNGRTARLLMNLLLLRAGYPPVAVRVEDRAAYLDALQQAQSGGVPPSSTGCCISFWTAPSTTIWKPPARRLRSRALRRKSRISDTGRRRRANRRRRN